MIDRVFKLMAFTRLDPPLPLHVLDRGKWRRRGGDRFWPEFDLLCVVGPYDGGEIWCVPDPQVRLQANWSMGRSKKPATGKVTAIGG